MLLLMLSSLLMRPCNSLSSNFSPSLEISESRNQTMEDQIFELMLFSRAFRRGLRRGIPGLCRTRYPHQCYQFLANRNTSEISFVRLFQIPGVEYATEVRYISNFFLLCDVGLLLSVALQLRT